MAHYELPCLGNTVCKFNCFIVFSTLTLLHSERHKLYTILAFLSAIGLSVKKIYEMKVTSETFWVSAQRWPNYSEINTRRNLEYVLLFKEPICD